MDKKAKMPYFPGQPSGDDVGKQTTGPKLGSTSPKLQAGSQMRRTQAGGPPDAMRGPRGTGGVGSGENSGKYPSVGAAVDKRL